MPHDYRRPSASASRRKEVFSRGHRKAHWPSPLLHLPRRERPHGSGDRDAGENGRALEVPLYQLFYDGEEPPELPNLPKRKTADEIAWGSSGKDARFLVKFRRLLGRVDEGDRKLLLYMAQKMANR